MAFEEFIKRLENDSLIIFIIGRRGSGKTALGFRILENIAANTNRKAFALAFPGAIPSWITVINSLDQAEEDSVVLVDEAALDFGVRSLGSSKSHYVIELFATARHVGVTLIFISQHSAIADLNILRMIDVLILKQPSLMQQRTERREIKEIYAEAEKAIYSLPKEDRPRFAYVLHDDYVGLMEIALPSFWNTNISKSYRNAVLKQKDQQQTQTSSEQVVGAEAGREKAPSLLSLI